MTTHFVTRQIFTGSGKLGFENGVLGGSSSYQISQRSDFFEEEVGLETTLRRPIINTRDEPHADALKYRRLHVIIGDANMSEVATLVKLGSTQILLAMIESGSFPAGLVLDEPLTALRTVSADLTLSKALSLTNGSTSSALMIQHTLVEAAESWCMGLDAETMKEYRWGEVLLEWRRMLSALSAGGDAAADMIDWVAKKRIIDAFQERHDLPSHDARLKAIDLQFHDLRRERCLAERAGLRSLVSDADVARALVHPPADTRAFFRGEMLRRWPDQVVAANWDSMVLDPGDGPLVRVPMDEPGRGTKALIGPLLNEAHGSRDVLRLLGLRPDEDLSPHHG